MQKKNKIIFLLSVRITMSPWVHIMYLNHSNSLCDLRMTWSSTVFENAVPGNRDVHPYQNLTNFYLHRGGEFNFSSLPHEHDRTFYWVFLNFISSLLRSHCLTYCCSRGRRAKRTTFTAPPAECRKKNYHFCLWSSMQIDSQAVLLRVSEEGKALLWLLKAAESLENLQQRLLIYVDASKSSVPDLRSLSGFSAVDGKVFWHLWKHNWSQP